MPTPRQRLRGVKRYGASTEEDQLASRFDQGRAVRQQPQWRYAKDQSIHEWMDRPKPVKSPLHDIGQHATGPMDQSGKLLPSLAERHPGGARRDRTDDLMLAKHALSQLSYGPSCFKAEMVGPGRLELPTSRLSGVRSNHLSYGPQLDAASRIHKPGSALRTLTREYVACEERETKAAKFRKMAA